jgi:hypothetical protein
MVFLKISLGIFFLRILIDRWQRRIIYTLVIISTLFGVAYFWYAVFQCGVPNLGKAFWEKRLENECTYGNGLIGIGYAHAGLMAVTDLTMAVLPIPILKRARISLREKIVVASILVLAALYVNIHSTK